VPEDDLQGRNM